MMVMRRMGGIAAALALFGAAPLAAQYFGQKIGRASCRERVFRTV